MLNSPRKGSVRCIVFQEEGDETVYGVALEFNVVVEGDDTDSAMFNLQEAIRGYMVSQKKLKGGITFSPLNQKSEKEYEDLWAAANSPEPIPSPYDIKYYGVTTV